MVRAAGIEPAFLFLLIGRKSETSKGQKVTKSETLKNGLSLCIPYVFGLWSLKTQKTP